ncbi:MAG: U32 family peptidase [Clostridia bacterium]|nr:U32 family peptidase [Clostridia bacterium]
MSFELLAPAGDMERLRTALHFGADAVYAGGPQLQLRANSVGFTMDQLAEGAALLHEAGKKLYVTVNAFARNDEADAAGSYARALQSLGVDGVIVADLGVIAAIREAAPDLPVHVSTQANCTNARAARLYHALGCRRVVLAREMNLSEIRRLREETPEDLELEAFVHGAMCMAYSGRCMMSAYLTGRSANRGDCTQSCRWRYHIVEQTRPGEFFPVEETEGGTTLLSSYDLNALPFLDQLMDVGIHSFKIEGRMKSAYYVATVVNAYRHRLDGTADVPALLAELDCASHRPYSSGFYFDELRRHKPDEGAYEQDCVFVGVVRQVSGREAEVEVRNKLNAGDALEVLSPASVGQKVRVEAMHASDGAPLERETRAGTVVRLTTDAPMRAGDFLRVRSKVRTIMH